MKKIKSLPLLMVLMFAITGCAQEKTVVTNKLPSIVGVKDFKCIVNTTIDFLDGVAALDKEDGDITPNMEIKISNDVPVNNGYATFTNPGSYLVNYKVSDSNGKIATKVAYVDVVSRNEYRDFKMAEGFYYGVSGASKVKTIGMVNGQFKVLADGGNASEDLTLNRVFDVISENEYTFKYTVNSNKKGKIIAKVNGEIAAEIALIEGNNTLVFKHTVKNNGKEEKVEADVSLCLGDLGNDIDLTILNVETEYPQEEGKLMDLTENFSFGGRVLTRFDNDGGNLDLEGNAFSHEGGSQAVLEVTRTSSAVDIWRGGMFIDTGIKVKAGVTYTVSFDAEAENESDYQVIIKKGQWGEDNFETLDTPNGHNSIDITVSKALEGDLWLYVQSGNAINRIALSKFKVEEHLGAIGHDTFRIQDYEEHHEGEANQQMETCCGNFKLHVNKFESTDWKQKVTSPAFFIQGSGANYVATFKAKATKPVEFVCAAPVNGGWDPTLFWTKITLTEEEQVYTLFCNGSASDRDYTIVWQFGSDKNLRFEDVDIEFSDVSINLRNRELDG